MRADIISKVIIASLTVFIVSKAQAVEMQVGKVDVDINTTVSIGASMRTGGQDCSKISSANGGCPDSVSQPTVYGINDDDGNVNTKRYGLISTTVKAVSDIGLKYENYGAFFRVKAFYDYWNAEEQGNNATRFGNRSMDDAQRGTNPTDSAGSGLDLLDAFVYGKFSVADAPLTLRLGSQVVNWGESVFITGGINSYLPVDVQALRTPGSEVKDALLPEGSLFFSLGLPGEVSIEGFYTYDYKKTKLDACGTFFSTTDAACQGGAYVLSVGPDDPDTSVVYIPRIADDNAREDGQYGLALRYYADWMNNGTELGLYFVNYHSKLPIGTFTAANLGDVSGAFTGNVAQDIVVGSNTKEYQSVYVEDIKEFGLSFNTILSNVLGGTALQGEILYTVDMPFQLSDVEINANDVENYFTNYNPGLGAAYAGVFGTSVSSIYSGSSVAEGDVIRGYSSYDVVTGQLGTTSTFSGSSALANLINSDLVVILGNAGFQWLQDYEASEDFLAVARSGTTHSNAFTAAILGNSCGCGTVQYADDFSWGYRIVMLADYNNVFDTPFKVQPFLQFGHDVHGYSAGPNGPGFVEGTKSVTIGTNVSRDAWTASISWTNRFGNKYYNSSWDKDFASATLSYAF
ncbi:MAG: DUF1302 family protein [Rhizobiales bacterium]|nr:DUF1302 family protein [Hyphomicrobiales bacterium]